MRPTRRPTEHERDRPRRVSPHGPILRFRLASLVAAQMFDFGTFTIMVDRHGVLSEGNPLVAQGFALFGMPVMAVLKIALIFLLAAVIVLLDRGRDVARRSPRLAASVAVTAVLAGLLGGVSNVLAT